MTNQANAKTSIVIVNYNTCKQVIACIDSLRNESLIKIIVVDNASPDDNSDSISIIYPEVVLIKNPKNNGFGDGCNIGMQWVFQNTDSTNIFFLNPDTIAEPGLISILESRLVEGKTGIVTPRITMFPETDKLWYGGGNFSWLKGSAHIPGYGKSSTAPLALLERDVQFASGCAFMIKRSVINECGGFDPDYFMYEEDVELSLRIISKGYHIHYTPDAVVHHQRQGSQSEKSMSMFDGKNPNLNFYVYYAARNRFRTVFKHGNFFQQIIFIIGFTAWSVYKGIGWLANGRFDAFQYLISGVADYNKKNKNPEF